MRASTRRHQDIAIIEIHPPPKQAPSSPEPKKKSCLPCQVLLIVTILIVVAGAAYALGVEQGLFGRCCSAGECCPIILDFDFEFEGAALR